MLAITNAKIFTVTNGIIENGSILIKDGKIIDVGESIEIPEEAEILDAAGKWVMPGLIDLRECVPSEKELTWEIPLDRKFGFTRIVTVPTESLTKRGTSITTDITVIEPSECADSEMERWKLQFDKLVNMEQQGAAFCLVRDNSTGPRLYLSMVGSMVAYGVSFDAVLRALTINSAKLLGQENLIGSIEAGKCAELAVFDGNPFLNTSLCEGSIVSGIIYKN